MIPQIPEKNLQRVSFMREVLACNPQVTLQAFADVFGLTRERIRQLMTRAGIPTKQVFLVKGALPRCMDCGTAFKTYATGKQCQPCEALGNRMNFTCGYCEAGFTRQKSEVRNIARHPKGTGRGPQFCSDRCKGKTAGALYGFSNLEHPLHTDPKYSRKKQEIYNNLT